MAAAASVPADPDLWRPPPSRTRPHPVPPGAPADLDIRSEAPVPLLPAQAALGTPLGAGAVPVDGSSRPHRLVVIGDSLSQGFQSFAIHRTEASWPALLANAFGFPFRFPDFSGPTDNPGLPFNLESIARAVQARLGDRPIGFDEPAALDAILHSLESIRDYWTRGAGAHASDQHGFVDNLAVWGFDLRDSMSKSRGESQAIVDEHVRILERLDPRRRLFASHSNELTTLRTLANVDDPSPDVTQVSAAQSLGAENGGEGVDTLIVALGSNNALQVVGALDIHWSADGFDDVHRKGAYNLWTPDHFRIELERLAAEVVKVHAARTIWLMVPHVTVVPILRGVGEKPYYSRYFPRYTHAWISDDEFDGNEIASLTGDEARMVDAAIDQYNWAIKDLVHRHRLAGDDWLVADLCGLLDRVAYQRYLASPQSRPSWWDRVPTEADMLPAALLGLSPRPDTRFFLSDRKGRTQGGLIALDGVHPTTIGYGLITDLVLHVMTDVAGLRRDDGSAPAVDWDALIADDTLIAAPPPQLTEIGRLIGPINAHIDVIETLLGRTPS